MLLKNTAAFSVGLPDRHKAEQPVFVGAARRVKATDWQEICMFAFTIGLALGMAQAPIYYTPPPPIPPGRGVIVFYRRQDKAANEVPCAISYQSQQLIQLHSGKYAEWAVSPGTYTLDGPSGDFRIKVKLGKTQFVRCDVRTGRHANNLRLRAADQWDYSKLQTTLQRQSLNEIAT